MTRAIPNVAIVGRTNVGKSTLFNAFAKRRIAIVEDRPGVTRDRNYTLIKHYGPSFTLIDTGGLVGEEDGSATREMLDSVREQTQIAIEQSDLVLVIFDGISGPQPHDADVVDLLRCSGKPVLWVVNKSEKPLAEVFAAEFYALGIDEFHCVSATHRMGLKELAEAIQGKLGEREVEPEQEKGVDLTIRVAVLGRPNVGKSTMINKILGEERLIASDVPGTTRDSIDTALNYEGQDYILIDTAGLRKKAKVAPQTLEKYGNLRTIRSLARCDVAVLVLDATQGMPGEQEQKIAALINERGRGVVLAVNKWDAIEKDHTTVMQYKNAVYHALHFVQYAPIVFTSAITGRRCHNVMEKVKEVYESLQLRLTTAELNRVLKRAFEKNPPPVHRGEPVKLYFATQTEVAPPTIVMFLNHPEGLKPSYHRYLKSFIRDEYPFEGVDIKLVVRKRTDKEQRKAEGELDQT